MGLLLGQKFSFRAKPGSKASMYFEIKIEVMYINKYIYHIYSSCPKDGF